MPRVKSTEKDLTVKELQHAIRKYKEIHCPDTMGRTRASLVRVSEAFGLPTTKPRPPPKPRAPRKRVSAKVPAVGLEKSVMINLDQPFAIQKKPYGYRTM